MKSRRVWVTGLGVVSSIGNSSAAVVRALLANQHGFEQRGFEELPDCPVSVLGTVEGYEFPSANYLTWRLPDHCRIPRSLCRGLPPHGTYVFAAMEEALVNAGLDRSDLGDGRTGLYASSAGSPFLQKEFLSEMDARSGTRGNPMGVVSTVAGTLNFNFGNYLGIRGANCGFVSACSSSAHAIGYAVDEIRSGRQDRIIVLAGEDLQKETILPFWAMRALAAEADPDRASCPFDTAASGFVGSGGGVCLVLEAEEAASRRAVDPYAAVLGWAQASDGFSTMAPHPDGEGLARAMAGALADADVTLDAGDCISAHATSTRSGDLSEVRAILTLMEEGNVPHSIPVSATKALTGHTLSMAGALQAVIASLGIREGLVAGNPGLQDPIEEAKTLDLVTDPRRCPVRRILSNSSGFGGSSVSLLLSAV